MRFFVEQTGILISTVLVLNVKKKKKEISPWFLVSGPDGGEKNSSRKCVKNKSRDICPIKKYQKFYELLS